MTAPRVSIVVPFLNAGDFIHEAIESVLVQTYDWWELLLVDDGSTDGSTAMARRYSEQHPGRLRYFKHPGHANRGASASRNVAIRAAKGDIIAFLDADDVYLPTKLEDQVALMDQHPEAALLYADTLYWHSWTGRPGDRDRDYMPPLGVPRDACIVPPRLVTMMLRHQAAVPCTCSMLVRRRALEDVGMFEEAFNRVYTDQVLYMKLLLTQTVYVANGCWDRYRQHPASCSTVVKRSGQRHATRLMFLAWLEGYLKQRRHSDPEVWSALRHAIWVSRHPGLAHYVGRTRQLARQVIGRAHRFTARTVTTSGK